MADPIDPDDEVVGRLLGVLRDDEGEPPPDLSARAIRRAHTSLTTRDLLDLTTVVFLMRFCAPLLDLVAAMLGAEDPERKGRRVR